MVDEERQPPVKRRKLKLSLSRCRSRGDARASLPSEEPEISSPLVEVEGRERVGADDEAYYSANFKAVCGRVLGEGSPEKHVLTESEAATVRLFMDLPGRWESRGYTSQLQTRCGRDVITWKLQATWHLTSIMGVGNDSNLTSACQKGICRSGRGMCTSMRIVLT
jgi:hypothetical protein